MLQRLAYVGAGSPALPEELGVLECPAAGRPHPAPAAARGGGTFSLRLGREVYYDNDSIEGTLVGSAHDSTLVASLSLALVCRFVCKDYTSPHYKKAHTLYRHVKAVGQDHYVQDSELTVPVAFTLPANEPASFDHKLCTVRWDVRLVRSGERGAHTLTRCAFRKASLYYAIPGHRPTAQAERRFYLGGSTLRIEASLGRDVYALGEPVDVTVALHNASRAVQVGRVRADVVQTAQAWDKAQLLVDKAYVLDSAKHDPARWPTARWPTARPDTPDGSVVRQHTFALLPQLDAEAKAGRQDLPGNGGPVRVLAPTAVSARTSKGLLCSLKYSVVLRVALVGAPDVRLALPFALGCCAPTPQPLHEHTVFPTVDEPPTYDAHRRLSVQSYTSLRRDSLDSVLADALPELPGPLGCGGARHGARRRYSLGSVGALPARPRSGSTSSLAGGLAPAPAPAPGGQPTVRARRGSLDSGLHALASRQSPPPPCFAEALALAPVT